IEAGVIAGDSSASGNVLTNDTDVDTGAVLTVAAVNGVGGNVGNPVGGTYGSVTINSNGTYTSTLNNPDPDTNALAQGASVNDVFSYTVTDEFGATSIANLTFFNDAATTEMYALSLPDALPTFIEAGVIAGDSSAS